MTWVATAIALVGAATNYYNTEKTAKRQDNQLARQIQQRSIRQQEADREVMQTITDRAASNGDDVRRGTLDQYLAQTRAAQGAATAGLRQAGAVSDAYRDSANDAALGIGNYASNTAGLMSRIDAPAQLREQENLGNARLASRLGLVGDRSASEDFLSNLRLQGIRRNAGLDAFSQVASAFAGAMSGGGGGGSTTSNLSGQANTITGANNAQINRNLQRGWGY